MPSPSPRPAALISSNVMSCAADAALLNANPSAASSTNGVLPRILEVTWSLEAAVAAVPLVPEVIVASKDRPTGFVARREEWNK